MRLKRIRAAWRVGANPRLTGRLPRIAALAASLNFTLESNMTATLYDRYLIYVNSLPVDSNVKTFDEWLNS